MKFTRLATALFAALALFATAASAAPGHAAPGKSHEHRKFQQHHQQHRSMHRYPPQHRNPAPAQSQWLWERQRDERIHNSQQYRHNHHNQHHRPPHRDHLRREIHRHSHHLRPGPPLPRHMHLVVGRPLPRGWSHKVPPGHVRHLPHYPGYEWHSAGRDLVLVAVATGVVYTILDNVLN